MPFDPRLVEAQLSLGRVHPEDIPDLAAQALEAGFDGPSPRRLAGLSKPSGWETDQLQPAFMQECGLVIIPLDQAALRIGRDLAKKILHERLDPLSFQRDFYRLWRDGGYVSGLQEIGNLDDLQYGFGQSEDEVRTFAMRDLADLLVDATDSQS